MQSPKSTGLIARVMHLFRPEREHGAASATALMMAAVLLSRVIGYLREAYIAWRFGAGAETDAFVAAFQLPDYLNYLVAGGTVSITFVTLLMRTRAAKREEEVHEAFSVVLSVMGVVLSSLIVLAMIFTPQAVQWMFPKFTPQKLALCAHITRILLPAQLFFYLGGVVGAVQVSQRKFLLPALAPLIYNAGIILGGIVLSPLVGIDGLAIGALTGCILGPFLVNAIGAARAGARFHFSFNTSHPLFREWLWSTIPLMIGVSVVAADEWIMRYFASAGTGDIARLNYAKRLFGVPIAVMGQAAGQASLPFFSQLFNSGKREELSRKVSENIGTVGTLALLGSSWLVVIARPLVDLVYRRGAFTASDTQYTAEFLALFSLSLVFWVAQNLYARAFYAANDTLTPMLYGTAITAASLLVYVWMFQHYGTNGLAMASNLAIFTHTLALALLLHIRGLVSFRDLPVRDLATTAIFSTVIAIAGLAGSGLNESMKYYFSHPHTRMESFGQILEYSMIWLVAVIVFAHFMRLPVYEQLKRRLRGGAPQS